MAAVPLILVRDPDDPECANLLIDGSVAGVPRRFILDTGASRTQLVAGPGLDWEPDGVERESGGVFEMTELPLARVRDLHVGPCSVDQLTVAVSSGAGAEQHDVLGMDVLGHQSWRLSMSELTLTAVPSLAAGAALDLHMGPRAHPFIDLAWGGTTAHACWDTGAGITVVDSGFVERHRALFSDESSARGTDSTGATRETATFLMAAPVIGGHRFAPHRVAVVDLSGMNATTERPAELILGFTTLCQADWTMDFPSRRWTVTMLSIHQRPAQR